MSSSLFIQPYGELGIPIHSRELVKELIKINDDINIVPLFNGDVSSLDVDIRKKMRKADYNGKAFIFWYPDSFDQLNGIFKKVIGYYIFEYNIIPKKYIESLNKTDIVVTASDWGKSVLIGNGVKSRIEVIRGGINTNRFPPIFGRGFNGPFVFGHVGKYEKRKNTDLLIESFLSLYSGNKNFKLLLSINNPYLKTSAKEVVESKFGKHENIEFVGELKNIRDFYFRVHCSVYPTNAEGIGLPIVESMASGIPTIVSFNSGITEYANDKNSILLTKLKEIPVYDELFFPNSGEFGSWMSPTKEELIEAMRAVVNNYSKYAELGQYSAKDMRDNFSWSEPARKLNELLIGE